jgi:hypothetical protein
MTAQVVEMARAVFSPLVAVLDRDPPFRHSCQKQKNEFSKTALPDTTALGVVRSDEPDCPGKRNLLTELIGLQRAAELRTGAGIRLARSR